MKLLISLCICLFVLSSCFFNSGNDDSKRGNTSDSITNSISNLADSMYHLLLEQKLMQDSIDKYLHTHDSIYEMLVKLDKDSFFIVGVWQDSDCIGSGWSDTYQFFLDGTFIFHSNQMDCSSRLISHSGKWTSQNNTIQLTIIEKTVWEGGKLVKTNGDGSCSSEFELVGAIMKTYQLSSPVQDQIQMNNISYEQELGRKTMLFNGVRYWRMSVLPEDYY